MVAQYDIQCGTAEETGEQGTWIVRGDNRTWTRIARFIQGEYTDADEAILGNADVLADALEALEKECSAPYNYSGKWDALTNARAALRAAGRITEDAA